MYEEPPNIMLKDTGGCRFIKTVCLFVICIGM